MKNWQKYFQLKNRIALCELELQNSENAGLILYSISQELQQQINLSKEKQIDKENLLKKANENLMIYLLLYDPNKALIFGEKQLQQYDYDLYIERFKTYVGLAEMLKDDILEAKDYLVASLLNNKEFELLNIAMNQNNLGVACWWDKYPNYSGILYESSEGDSEEEFSEQAQRSKDSDFFYTEHLFKDSIKNFEKHMYYEYKQKFPDFQNNFEILKQILDFFDVFDYQNRDFKYLNLISKNFKLINPLSVIPLMNLTEYYLIDNDSIDKGLFFLHLSFHILFNNIQYINSSQNQDSKLFQFYYQDYKDQYISLYIRCLTLMASVEKQDISLSKKLFLNIQNVFNYDKLNYNIVFYLNRYGRFLKTINQTIEGNLLIQKSYQIESNLNTCASKLNHLVFPNLKNKLSNQFFYNYLSYDKFHWWFFSF